MTPMPLTLPTASMLKDYPDHHDAELVLRLYELRRDPVMRESRALMYTQFLPKSYEELKGVATNVANPLNAAFRQTSTYWEMTYGMAKHGIIHADFLMESGGEGLLLYAKALPWLPKLREETGRPYFQNAEWVVAHSEVAKATFARFTANLAKQRSAK
jgi:hypothetical protein